MARIWIYGLRNFAESAKVGGWQTFREKCQVNNAKLAKNPPPDWSRRAKLIIRSESAFAKSRELIYFLRFNVCTCPGFHAFRPISAIPMLDLLM